MTLAVATCRRGTTRREKRKCAGNPNTHLYTWLGLNITEPLTDHLPLSSYPPLEPFEHYEHGKDADPSFKNLLKAGSRLEDITASIGAEVSGVQLSSLDNKGRDELALLVAQKKVVAFRDQDFASLPIEKALEFGRYFGRLHIHPTRYD